MARQRRVGALSGREVCYSSREFHQCQFRRKLSVLGEGGLAMSVRSNLYLILSKVGCGGAQGIFCDFFRHEIWCCTIEQSELAIANVRF